MRRFLLCCAKFFQVALPIEVRQCLAAAKSSGLIHLLREDESNSTGDAEGCGGWMSIMKPQRMCRLVRRLKALRVPAHLGGASDEETEEAWCHPR